MMQSAQDRCGDEARARYLTIAQHYRTLVEMEERAANQIRFR
jgi:hypothetical protein